MNAGGTVQVRRYLIGADDRARQSGGRSWRPIDANADLNGDLADDADLCCRGDEFDARLLGLVVHAEARRRGGLQGQRL